MEKLRKPFSSFDIEWRIGRSGEKNGRIWATALAYVTNRAIQDRLDDVFGVEGWQNTFRIWHEDSQLCGISAKFGDEWVTKWDGADNTNFEKTKGGLSDSMKRAAVQWGIGRYLYNLTETFVEISDKKKDGWHYTKTKDNKIFFWKTPVLPTWALPSDEQPIKQKRRNYTDEAAKCETMDELKEWFSNLNIEEKKQADAVKNNRKHEIMEVSQNEVSQNKNKSIDIIVNLINKAKTDKDLSEIDTLISTIEENRHRLALINDLKKKMTDLKSNYVIESLPF